MRRRRAIMTAAAAAVLCAASVSGAGAATGAHAPATATLSVTWGNAVEIPGTSTLNKAGQAGVAAISCADSADCSAGGSYASSLSSSVPVLQVYVVNRTFHSWRNAKEVPGSAGLNTGGSARITSVTCAAAGDCLAGGSYTQTSGQRQAFVVSETNGTWGTAEKVPGTAALNLGHPGATVTSASCTAPGDCLVGGRYTDGSGNAQAFVVSETNGTWGKAQEVRGTAALNAGGYAEVDSVSCASAGNCSAGGAYTDSTPATQAFVVNETNGTWGTAEEVPGTASLNTAGRAQVNSVACAAPGDCSAGGFYLDSSFNTQAFVVNETNGSWGTVENVPAIPALDQGSPGARVASVSCVSAGNCSAGGSYSDAADHQQAFVVSETGGTWGTAEEVPGSATLNAGGLAGIGSVSCAPGGLCSAAGSYTDVNNHTQAFAVSETSR
jgi:hypothetical protein